MRRGVRCALSSIVLAAGLAAIAVPAASADSYCPDYYACFWTGEVFTGSKKTVPASQGGNGWITLDGEFRNNIESSKNRFDYKTVCFSTTGDGSGYFWAQPPGSGNDVLSFGGYNNRIRAFKVTVNFGFCP